MSLMRTIVCVLLPPAAVIDKGCGSLLLVIILWLLGWMPGVIATMVICAGSNKNE